MSQATSNEAIRSPIEGLKVTIAGQELRDLCVLQADFHKSRAITYAEQSRNLEGAEIEGMHYSGGDPKKALKDKQAEHENKHRELMFIADHLKLDEEYLLDRSALAEIGVIRSSRSFF